MSTMTDAYHTILDKAEVLFKDLEVLVGLAAKYAPAAAAVADTVEVATGNPELVPVTNAAASAAVAAGTVVGSTSVNDAAANAQAAVVAVRAAVVASK